MSPIDWRSSAQPGKEESPEEVISREFRRTGSGMLALSPSLEKWTFCGDYSKYPSLHWCVRSLLGYCPRGGVEQPPVALLRC